ncbi:MAG: DUF354 domain-containing protein [Candidatus Bathyarchaeia archaeon]
MRIWYDAGTGKHIRYGVAIGKRMRSLGHEFILTTRKHPDTLPLARFLGEDPIIVGRYAPESRLSRLRESLRRQIAFCRLFGDNPPDLAIMHVSVECARVAFGLRVPLISTFDTVHAEAQNRLTLPLVDVVIASRAIPEHVIYSYGARKVIQFDGVDEVAWMRDFKPPAAFDFKRPFIVVRQSEVKAAYAEGIVDVTEKIAEKLTLLGEVIYLTRYERRPRKRLIIPRRFIDSASLAAQADLVVSVGGTISREAALAGTPSIVINIFGKIHVNKYLADKGFPIFTVKPEDVTEYAKKYLGKRFDVKDPLRSLEDPVSVIERLVEKFSREHSF